MSGKRKARERNRKKKRPLEPEAVNGEREARGQRKYGTTLAILVVAALAGATFFLQSSEPKPERSTDAGEYAIPDPDTSKMEPQVATAIGNARAAVVSNPRVGAAWAKFAFVLDAHSLFDSAEPAYRRAIELEPGNLRYTYNFAALLEGVGRDLDRSLKLLQKFAELNPDYPPVQVRIGSVLELKGEPVRAVEAYRRAIELDPEFAFAHRCLGQTLLILDDCEGAIVSLERAAGLVPFDSTTQASLAQAYSCLGKGALAVAAGERATQLGLGEPMPYADPVRSKVTALGVSSKLVIQQATALKVHGNYAAALDLLKALEETRPNSARLHDSLAEVYRLMGDDSSSSKHTERARLLRENRARLDK